MQHIVQEVVETLNTFVGHGEQSVMLIEAVTDEAPLLLKCFDIVERDELSNDIFLMHGDEFQDTRLFVETIIERQREQIEGVNEELEKRGDEKIEEIPPVLFERNAPSVERSFRFVSAYSPHRSARTHKSSGFSFRLPTSNGRIFTRIFSRRSRRKLFPANWAIRNSSSAIRL